MATVRLARLQLSGFVKIEQKVSIFWSGKWVVRKPIL